MFVDRSSSRLIGSSRYFVDTVIFWVGEKNWRSQGAMTKIGGVPRSGLFTRELSGATPHFIFAISKDRYEKGGRALVA